MPPSPSPTPARTDAGPPRCPLCAAGSHPAFMAGEHRLYRCDACRTAFVHPQPTPEALRQFYDTYHLHDAAGGMYDVIEDRMQADFPAKVARVMRDTGGRPGRLLDVGCGKGFFVKACVDAGLDAQGCDLSETGTAYAREKLGVRATAGLLAEVGPRLGAFDTVTFWATIEHLPDPVATLKDIRAVLKPGGRLFLDTGIGDDWLDRTLPGRVQWYDPPQHLFVFSRAGMEKALSAAGFALEHFDPCFDRTPARRLVRKVRNGALAVALRAAAELGRMRHTGFVATRLPVGNLMSVCARREG